MTHRVSKTLLHIAMQKRMACRVNAKQSTVFLAHKVGRVVRIVVCSATAQSTAAITVVEQGLNVIGLLFWSRGAHLLS